MNEITKFAVIWLLLIVYTGFVFGYAIELFTIERQSLKVWSGRGLLVLLLIAPSVIMSYAARPYRRKTRKK